MIKKDFIIDLEKKLIYHSKLGSTTIYSVQKLYAYLQDMFDEPENMKFEIPIQAVSKTKFILKNGWKIEKKSFKYLKNGTITFKE